MVKGFSPLVLLGVVVVIVIGGVLVVSQSDLDLQLAPCTPPNCFGGGITPAGKVGNVSRVDPIPDDDNQVKVKFPLFTDTEKLYIDDPINKIYPALSKKELPTILRDGKFSGNVVSNYKQGIIIGPPALDSIYSRIVYAKQPTVDSEPIDGINIGLNAQSNRAYISTVNFNPHVDFTSSMSKGKNIVLFGKTYKVHPSTTQYQIVLVNTNNPNDIINLEDGQEVSRGFDEEDIDGTLVDFDGVGNDLLNLHIFIAAPDSDRDAITLGQPFIDPVFGTFQISYEGLSIPDLNELDHGTIERQIIGITHDYVPHELEMDLKVDSFNYAVGVPFVVDVNGTPYLGYGPTKQIRITETRDVKKGEFLVVGDHDNGRLLELIDINNATSGNGYSDDEVWFIDRLSGTGDSYHATITSEGHGTINIQGKIYEITYSGSSGSGSLFVRLNYPQSPNDGTGIFYPVFKNILGAKVMYYEPIYMNLNTLPPYFGGTVGGVLKIRIPNGNNYDEITFTPTNTTGVYVVIVPNLQAFVLDTRPTSNNNTNINFQSGNSGKLNWKIVKTETLHRALIYLEPVGGVGGVMTPALVIFENKSDTGYEALIVKPEFTGPKGAGLSDVETTWGQDLKFDELNMESKPNVYRSVDRYGTFVWTDRTDSDQWISGIFYPKEQVYAKVYLQEI